MCTLAESQRTIHPSADKLDNTAIKFSTRMPFCSNPKTKLTEANVGKNPWAPWVTPTDDVIAPAGKAKSRSFREHDVTHLCVVLYLHAAHEYNLISAPLTGYGTETMRRRRHEYLYIHAYIHTYVRTYARTYMYVCIHVCNPPTLLPQLLRQPTVWIGGFWDPHEFRLDS